VHVCLKAYLDGSGKKESHFIVLSGVAADDRAWHGFEDQWKKILAERTPKAEYLHMNEIGTLTEGFSMERGWTEELAGKLVTDCLMYLQTLDKERFRIFTCSMDLDSYREIRSKGGLLPDCHDFCVYYSPQRILDWYLARFNDTYPQELNYFFDQGERFRGLFEKRWISGKKSGRGLSTHWHLIKQIGTVDSKDQPAVQFADLIAWAHHRKMMSDRYGPAKTYAHLATIAEKILPSDRKDVDRPYLEQAAFWYQNYPSFYHERSFPK
jgi:hypothetical protein